MAQVMLLLEKCLRFTRPAMYYMPWPYFLDAKKWVFNFFLIVKRDSRDDVGATPRVVCFVSVDSATTPDIDHC